MSVNKDAQYREECREAIRVFDESGALVAEIMGDETLELSEDMAYKIIAVLR